MICSIYNFLRAVDRVGSMNDFLLVNKDVDCLKYPDIRIEKTLNDKCRTNHSARLFINHAYLWTVTSEKTGIELYFIYHEVYKEILQNQMMI